MEEKSHVASWVCIAILVATTAACGPALPKTATKNVSDTVSGLSDSFASLEKAYVANATDGWVIAVVNSGQRVGRSDTCTDAETVKSASISLINAALSASAQNKAVPLAANWEPQSKALQDALAKCALEVRKGAHRPVKVPLVPNLPEGDSYGEINTKFNKEFHTLIFALSGYYSAVGKAAQGEDIEKEAAAARAVVKAGSKVVGKVASVFAMGADVGPLLEAVGNLAVALRTAASEAARYNAIQTALEAVRPEEMETIEDALGLSVVYMQANIVNGILRGRVDQQIAIFNGWNPQDRLGSTERLRAAMAGIDEARSAAPAVLPKGISQLSELHETLVSDIKKRDGTFSATFDRLVVIGEAAGAVRDATTKLQPKD